MIPFPSTSKLITSKKRDSLVALALIHSLTLAFAQRFSGIGLPDESSNQQEQNDETYGNGNYTQNHTFDNPGVGAAATCAVVASLWLMAGLYACMYRPAIQDYDPTEERGDTVATSDYEASLKDPEDETVSCPEQNL